MPVKVLYGTFFRNTTRDVRSLSRLFTNKLATDGLRLSHKKVPRISPWDLNPYAGH